MENLKIILPLIGVIIGFLLGLIKEMIQYKSIVKTDFKYVTGDGFCFYYINEHELPIQTSSFSESDYFEINIKIDIYNIGRKNTAIKDINIEVYYEDHFFRQYAPKLSVNNQYIPNLSFNLKSGEILTLNLNLQVPRDDETQFIFNDKSTLLDDTENSLFFRVVITDIYGKKYYEVIKQQVIYLIGAVEKEVASSNYIQNY